jgi:outer membrane protein assembly factor BamB
MRRATLLVAALALLAGCGGSDEPSKKGGTPAGKAAATPDPDTIVRWPRFWAVREGAETGSDDNLDTRYMAGYDENAIVYNGQDVVRVLAKKDGRQMGRVLLPRDRFVCATPPRREIDAGVAVFGVGTLGRNEGTCDQVIGVSTTTGKKVWSSPKIPGGGIIDPLLDARDGVTMFSNTTTLVAFDTATGKQLWRRSAAKIAHARRAFDRRDCEIASALAADRPVIIVYPSDCSSSFDPTELYGLELKTGKELWATEDPRDPDLYSPYLLVPHPLDGRLLGVISNGDDRKAPDNAAFVESDSGNATRYKMPADAQEGEDTLCTDFATEEGLEWSDVCIFVAGKHILHVHTVQSVPDNEDYIEIVAGELSSGVPEWRFRWDGDGTPDGQAQFLGLNAARDEFWVGEGDQDVERLSVDTGKRVGRGQLRPGVELPRFGVAGPDFVMIRGVAGISDVKSGLDYFATKAPSG